jgi:hypothetical protein
MRTVLVSAALLAAIAMTEGAAGQSAALPVEAEYQGALLRTPPQTVTFYPSGRVMNGVLRSDYSRDGVTYTVDTMIWFFEDGSVWRGTLKTPAKLGELTFEPGVVEFQPSGRVRSGIIAESKLIDGVFNALRSTITFRDDGRMVTVAPLVENNLSYRVLDRTILGRRFDLSWNVATGRYEFRNYTAGAAQLVARLATSWSSSSLPEPFTIVPVLVPSGSTMTRNNANAAEDYWAVPTPGDYVLNGVNYGPGVVLRVRDMQLVSVMVRRPTTVGGVTYPANTSILFDAAGRPAPVGGPTVAP